MGRIRVQSEGQGWILQGTGVPPLAPPPPYTDWRQSTFAYDDQGNCVGSFEGPSGSVVVPLADTSVTFHLPTALGLPDGPPLVLITRW